MVAVSPHNSYGCSVTRDSYGCSVTTSQLLLQCHHTIVMVAVSPHNSYGCSVTTQQLWLQCHHIAVMVAVSPHHSYCCSVTTQQLWLQCHHTTVIVAVSPRTSFCCSVTTQPLRSFVSQQCLSEVAKESQGQDAVNTTLQGHLPGELIDQWFASYCTAFIK